MRAAAVDFTNAEPTASPLGAVMPSNIEVEQALLGILLYDNEAFGRLPDKLHARHFYEPFHQRLFAAMEERIRRSQLAQPILLADRFKRDPAFEELGGQQYLADLMDKAPPAANAPDYARTIYDLALRRELIRIGGEIAASASTDGDGPALEQIEAAEQQLYALAEAHGGNKGEAVHSGAEAIDQALEHAETFGRAPEFPTGLGDLDRVLGGSQRGELTILAGRPGSGKTLVGLCLARTMASAGAGICYYSMEMSAHALGLRLGCDVAFRRGGYEISGPTMAAIATGNATREQLYAIAEARQTVSVWPLQLDCRPGLTVSKIEQSARRRFRDWQRQGIKPGPIFVDHLGLARPEKDRQGSRHAEVADVSRALAELAKRLDVPVIALCQLNRGVESREDKRPMLSDLRQAGELEEDARVVLMLHRPAYYFRPPDHGESFEQQAERMVREDRDRNLLRIIVAKNSNGPTEEVETFVDVTRSAVRDREARS